MRYWLWTLAAALALAPLTVVAHGPGKDAHEHQHGQDVKAAAAETHTVEGNVLDLACFFGHGADSKEHVKCAKDCVVRRGLPAGIIGADGVVYLLVEDHANAKAYDTAKKLAGEKAKVTGRVVKKGGLQALVVATAEKGK
ncbi:MAG: hypothetical protein HY554_07805 [Elusimicrobia bacterium]|nr:hypothetical protein [Elusimicrobiota bacterium]